MRALADGRVRWGFWPPDSDPEREGIGIWLEGTGLNDEKDDDSEVGIAETASEKAIGEDADEQGEDEDETEEGDEDEAGEEGEEAEEVVANKRNNGGFFAALNLELDEEDSERDAEDEAE